MGFLKLLPNGKKAARIAAKATEDTAAKQAANDRIVAQGAQNTRETAIAQNKAGMDAAELLNRPQEQIDVQLAPETPAAEIDPATGRRRTTRSSFQSPGRAGSGIRIN